MSDERYVLLKIGDRSSFIVARFVQEDESEVTLHFPVIMSLSFNDEGELELNPSKWMPFVEDDMVHIQKEAIVAIASPKQNIVEHYVKFIQSNPQLQGSELEQEVLTNSAVRAAESEYLASTAVH